MWADLFRVIGLWAPRGAWLLGGALLAVAAALSGLALMGLAGQGVAAGLAGASAGLLLAWLRPLAVLRAALRWAERMGTHEATFRALSDTRVWFFRRLAERLPAGIGMRRSGELLGRLTADVEALDGLFLRAIVPAAAAAGLVLAVALLLGAASAWLAVLVAAPLGLALLLPVLLAPAFVAAGRRAAAAEGELRAAIADPLVGLEDTLAANAEVRALARVAEAERGWRAAEAAMARRAGAAGAAGALLGQAALLGALGYGLFAGLGPEVAGPALLGLFLAVAAAETIGLLPRAGTALAAAAAAARRLFEAADTRPPVPEPALPAPPPAGHAIAFRGVRFAWAPDRPPVFDGLDLEVPEGARIAILGPSGAGKSSLAALLLKQAAPQAGTITLGGADIAALAADTLRARIGILSQDARLFAGSVAENLRLAAPEADDAALWRALDAARIGDLIRALPEGLDTEVGEGGIRFSGGEARRIALARALLSPAPVLILDEPAAGLDAATERAFLETLGAATAGRTVILLLHGLTGVERPTRILRLIGGKAVAAAG
ncbi:MAG: thiol reductant ABC exporter subunit CydC [Acetobacteraceae bacterium]|nr:thiol reductant ABC exporter subunit CydC [Acetobacteraceae bacterium]